MHIILASASKRRSQILKSCGIRHKVIVSEANEIMKHASPKELCVTNAHAKAKKVAGKVKSGYVIGADTIVLLGKKIIGKPRNATHAKSMLKEMSGKKIGVYTGLCIIDVKQDKKALGYERSSVKVKKLSPSDIDRYFKLLGPYDKAGGFSIEGVGSFIFDDITGSYFNVLGLPMAKLKEMFERLGVDILTWLE